MLFFAVGIELHYNISIFLFFLTGKQKSVAGYLFIFSAVNMYPARLVLPCVTLYTVLCVCVSYLDMAKACKI